MTAAIVNNSAWRRPRNVAGASRLKISSSMRWRYLSQGIVPDAAKSRPVCQLPRWVDGVADDGAFRERVLAARFDPTQRRSSTGVIGASRLTGNRRQPLTQQPPQKLNYRPHAQKPQHTRTPLMPRPPRIPQPTNILPDTPLIQIRRTPIRAATN